jgi:hypothetical protein
MHRYGLLSRAKLGVMALAAFGALVAGFGPMTASASNDALTIRFVKDCPGSTCSGYLVRERGEPIQNSSDSFAPTSAKGFPVIHFTANETVSSRHGNLNISSTGTIDCSVTPTTVVANGTVVSGTWKGDNLSGSPIHEVGHRVTNDPCGSNPAFSHTFVGTLWVFAESDSQD